MSPLTLTVAVCMICVAIDGVQPKGQKGNVDHVLGMEYMGYHPGGRI